MRCSHLPGQDGFGGGVHVTTGVTTGLHAGVVTNPAMVARITRSLAREGASTKENLQPVFNEHGEIIAYTRTVDPAQLKALNQNRDIAKMVGVWKGRQVEEAMAESFNQTLITKLHNMFTNAQDKSTFVDLFNPKALDPVLRDAVRLLPDSTRDYIQSKFGDHFMVRKDLLNDVLGYRNPSVGDAWTGNSRWSPEVQKTVQNLAMAAFGNEAYRKMVNAEKFYQGVIKDMKSILLVKSVIMPFTMFAANMGQLLTRGVSLTDLRKGVPSKLIEIRSFMASEMRKVEALAELEQAKANQDRNGEARLTAEIQSLKDSQRRLAIWPLIEAGHFGIPQEGFDKDDPLLAGGALDSFLGKAIDKLPPAVQTMGRYALLTRDTALYKALEKSIEYGDLIIKSVYFDHLIQRKGLSEHDALSKISDDFDMWSRLEGRGLSYLNSMGFGVFLNYKLRSAKVAVSMLRDNPLQALMTSQLNAYTGGLFEGPLQENVFTQAAEGKKYDSAL